MTDPMELVGRLEDLHAILRGQKSHAERKNSDGNSSDWEPSDRVIAVPKEAAACIREMVDKREGLEEDLYQAVSVAYHRGATEWARRNYPQWTAWIEEGRACLPPAPGAEA